MRVERCCDAYLQNHAIITTHFVKERENHHTYLTPGGGEVTLTL